MSEENKEIVNLNKEGKERIKNQSMIIVYSYNLGIEELPNWVFDTLTPRRAKMLMQFMLDEKEYYDLFIDTDLFKRLFTDENIDDDTLEDILYCFNGGYNIYDQTMANIPIGPRHIKEFRRIIENRMDNLISYEDAAHLISLFDDVKDPEETEVLNKIQNRRIEMLNATRDFRNRNKSLKNNKGE